MLEGKERVYIEKNLNPSGKKTSDCAIRAVAAATDQSWDKVYMDLANTGFQLKKEMSDVDTVDRYLTSLGFITGKIKVAKGQHRPTVEGFARNNPDKVAVLRVANHLTCCAYGNYVDIWDCGDCSVYKYWYKELRG